MEEYPNIVWGTPPDISARGSCADVQQNQKSEFPSSHMSFYKETLDLDNSNSSSNHCSQRIKGIFSVTSIMSAVASDSKPSITDQKQVSESKSLPFVECPLPEESGKLNRVKDNMDESSLKDLKNAMSEHESNMEESSFEDLKNAKGEPKKAKEVLANKIKSSSWKPPYAYAAMCIMAFQIANKKLLTVREIIQHLCAKFPILKDSKHLYNRVWKCLSSNRCFVKATWKTTGGNEKPGWIVNYSDVSPKMFKRRMSGANNKPYEEYIHDELGMEPVWNIFAQEKSRKNKTNSSLTLPPATCMHSSQIGSPAERCASDDFLHAGSNVIEAYDSRGDLMYARADSVFSDASLEIPVDKKNGEVGVDNLMKSFTKNIEPVSSGQTQCSVRRGKTRYTSESLENTGITNGKRKQSERPDEKLPKRVRPSDYQLSHAHESGTRLNPITIPVERQLGGSYPYWMPVEYSGLRPRYQQSPGLYYNTHSFRHGHNPSHMIPHRNLGHQFWQSGVNSYQTRYTHQPISGYSPVTWYSSVGGYSPVSGFIPNTGYSPVGGYSPVSGFSPIFSNSPSVKAGKSGTSLSVPGQAMQMRDHHNKFGSKNSNTTHHHYNYRWYAPPEEESALDLRTSVDK